MIPPSTVRGLDQAFDDFLQAPIDEDAKERLLSVVSALARLDLDPWKEAEELTALPRAAAIQRLAGLISTLPVASGTERNPATIATRLISLLPRKARRVAITPVEETVATKGSATLSTAWKWVLYVLLMTAMLLSWFHMRGPAPMGSDPEASSSTAPCSPLAVCGKSRPPLQSAPPG